MIRQALLATTILSVTIPAALAQGACSGGNPASGPFSVSNGKIVGANGEPFVARGINTGTIGINGRDETISIMDTMASSLTKTFPGVNMVRVPIWQNAINQGLSASDLQADVKSLNAQGVVVEFEYHDYSTTLAGDSLSSVANWYSGMASAFKGNSGVFFGSQNEPPGGDISTEISTLYNAVRSTGNNTIFMMTESGGYSTNGIDPSVFTNMHNVVWDHHFYSWEPNGLYGFDPTNQAQNSQALANNISSLTNFTHSADGTIPIIIGEYGPAAGDAMDTGGDQTVKSVQQGGVGSIAWAWDTFNSGSPIPGDLVNPGWTGGRDNVTSWGQSTAQFLSSCEHPVAAAIQTQQTFAPAEPSQNQFNQGGAAPQGMDAQAEDGSGAVPQADPIILAQPSPSGEAPPLSLPPQTTAISASGYTELQGADGNHSIDVTNQGNVVTELGGQQSVTVSGNYNAVELGAYDDSVNVSGVGNSINAGGGLNVITLLPPPAGQDEASPFPFILQQAAAPGQASPTPGRAVGYDPLNTPQYAGNVIVLPSPGTGEDIIHGKLRKLDRIDLTQALAGTTWDHTASSIQNYVTSSRTQDGLVVQVSGKIVAVFSDTQTGDFMSYVVAR